MMQIETRSGHNLQTAPQGRLAGYAVVFDSLSLDLGGFREVIKPGAFLRTLAKADHVRALYDHDSRMLLGRVGSDTLQLREDKRGLYFECQPPNTSYANDLMKLVERGDVAGCSFAFRVRPGGETWETRNGENIRVLTDLELSEITITANPAYENTEVALRSKPAKSFWEDDDYRRLWLETCR